MAIGARIRDRRGELNLSQARLARDLGVDQSTVAKWESGPNVPRPKMLERLAAALGTNVSWLLTGETGSVFGDTIGLGASAGIRVAGPLRAGAEASLRDLPVLGVVVGGDDAYFELNGQVHEYVERPAQLEEVRNAYALYVVGTSMEPRYFEGEIVYINPNRPVTKGCFVAVELKGEGELPGKGMIKQFTGRTPTKLMLRQFNPERQLEVPLDEVRHCHRIVQGGEP